MMAGLYAYRFEERLRELGHVNGETVRIERRVIREAEGHGQLDSLATELVKLPVAVLVTTSSSTALAAKRATRTIPVVMVGGADPVELGLVTSLAHPGENVTGLSSLSPGLSGKRLELLKEITPTLSRVAIAWHPDDLDGALQFRATEHAAQSLGVQVHSLELRSATQMASKLEEAIRLGAGAFLLLDESGSLGRSSEIATLALQYRLPAIADDRLFTERWSGGLMSVGPSREYQARRGAEYVDKILKGARPKDLPIEQPTTFDFIVNLKTAKALGLMIPQSVLVQATEIIQ